MLRKRLTYIAINSYNIQLIPVFKRLINENKNKYKYKINVVSCVGIPSSRITRFAQKIILVFLHSKTI